MYSDRSGGGMFGGIHNSYNESGASENESKIKIIKQDEEA
jgi:hypothetical protein